jgi:septum formation protein
VIVLASASPRRSRILRQLGVPFRVRVAEVDETLLPGERGDDAALRLARAKAAAVSPSEELAVLAADTLVVLDGEALGKPIDATEARAMLGRLSGRSHEVVTGVCLAQGDRQQAALARTEVQFAKLQRSEIDTYVESGEPLDRAGAYHIDGGACGFIVSVQGSPSNVAGLPAHLVLELLRGWGLHPA